LVIFIAIVVVLFFPEDGLNLPKPVCVNKYNLVPAHLHTLGGMYFSTELGTAVKLETGLHIPQRQ